MRASFFFLFSGLIFGLIIPGLRAQDPPGGKSHGQNEAYEVVFEPVAGRFFRLVSFVEAGGNDRSANAAELHILQATDGKAVSREEWTVAESSNRDGRDSKPGINALDNEPSTVWRSQGEPPHYLDIDLNEVVAMSGFRYLPSVEEPGAIHRFSAFVSSDGVNWGDPVMRGTLVPRSDGRTVDTSQGAPDPIALERQDFAPEGMVYGPVAIDVDPQNRVYVAETHRYEGRGVIDNRGKKRREEDDLQTNSLEQRRVFLEKWLTDGELENELTARSGLFLRDGSDYFTKFSEKVSLLEDVNGDGRADFRRVVADGFNDILDGAAAGVLQRGNDLYFACIPSIWLLSDTDGDDVMDKRTALSRGYGVRTGWFGHDLHGLTWGPDGRLYFSVADRGYDVRTMERTVIHGPNTGAVFRCWPDGSALELVASGLRNPQELAFDDLGYLFTGDNNCDAGDRARLVYVVQGGDSGWRVSVQSLADRGPWLSEAMWELPRPDDEALQPAWILPPLAHLNSGPAGMAAYPGTGLPPSYDGYFFLCDYRGGRGSIQSFRVDPKGASFAMSGHHAFHDGYTVSDLCFGYDGRVYVSEWGPGWDISPHARIYTLAHAATQRSADAVDVGKWFRQGFDQFEDARLGELLAHRDRRVRYEAQRLLVARRAAETLTGVLNGGGGRLARLHAVWGIGQLAVADASLLEAFLPHLNDPDPEVLGRILRISADHGLSQAGEAAKIALGAVNHPRLRFHAAYAVGKLRPEGAMEALLQLVQANHDRDPYLRHAAVMGLVSLNGLDALVEQASSSPSEEVRLAAVLVLRRQVDGRVRLFLDDSSKVVATEAARAIYDREITGSMQALAASLENVIDREGTPAPFLQRAIQANFQLGTEIAADRLCRFARAKHQAKAMRQLAMDLLLAWDTPPEREGVWGRWRPQSRSSAGLAKGPVRTYLQDMLEIEDRALQALAQRLDALYGQEKTPQQLAAMVQNANTTEPLRIDALLALEKVRDAYENLFNQVCQLALTAPESPALRAAAVQSWARVRGDAASNMVEQVVESGVTALEKQAGVRAAATLSAQVLKRLMGQWMTALIEGQLDPQIQLDVFELAENSEDVALREQSQAYRQEVGALGIHQLSLKGGDAARGQVLYETNLAAQCMRCHALRGKGGDVGPPLDGLARRRRPEHILRSVVDPQADVVKGYGMQNVTLVSGDLVTGTLVSENEKTIVIRQDGKLRRIDLDRVAQRSQVVSGMPPAGLVLKPRELRDLLAFLQTLK